MANEKPCIYKHTCGYDFCMMSDCPEYVPKTKGRKWFEEEGAMNMWKLTDVDECGYEYECPACGRHICTRRKGIGLPEQCPYCNEKMDGERKDDD